MLAVSHLSGFGALGKLPTFILANTTAIYTSVDGGATFPTSTALTSHNPQDMATDGQGTIVSIASSGSNRLAVSKDYGATWTLVATPTAMASWGAAAIGYIPGSGFRAFGSDGTQLEMASCSDDPSVGGNWTAAALGGLAGNYNVLSRGHARPSDNGLNLYFPFGASNGGLYYASATGYAGYELPSWGPSATAGRRSDGTTVMFGSSGQVYSGGVERTSVGVAVRDLVHAGSGVWYAVSSSSTVLKSTDNAVTFSVAATLSGDLSNLYLSNGVFYTVNTSGQLYKSVDGTSWTTLASVGGSSCYGMAVARA